MSHIPSLLNPRHSRENGASVGADTPTNGVNHDNTPESEEEVDELADDRSDVDFDDEDVEEDEDEEEEEDDDDDDDDRIPTLRPVGDDFTKAAVIPRSNSASVHGSDATQSDIQSLPQQIMMPPAPRERRRVEKHDRKIDLGLHDHKAHPDCPDTLACLPDTDGRPQHTLPVILRCAILGSPRKRLTIREIYATMETKYPYYRTAGQTWKQSVRHHLSLNRLFERQPRPVTDPGFGSYWTVNLSAPPGTKRPRKRGRANKDIIDTNVRKAAPPGTSTISPRLLDIAPVSNSVPAPPVTASPVPAVQIAPAPLKQGAPSLNSQYSHPKGYTFQPQSHPPPPPRPVPSPYEHRLISLSRTINHPMSHPFAYGDLPPGHPGRPPSPPQGLQNSTPPSGQHSPPRMNSEDDRQRSSQHYHPRHHHHPAQHPPPPLGPPQQPYMPLLYSQQQQQQYYRHDRHPSQSQYGPPPPQQMSGRYTVDYSQREPTYHRPQQHPSQNSAPGQSAHGPYLSVPPRSHGSHRPSNRRSSRSPPRSRSPASRSITTSPPPPMDDQFHQPSQPRLLKSHYRLAVHEAHDNPYSTTSRQGQASSSLATGQLQKPPTPATPGSGREGTYPPSSGTDEIPPAHGRRGRDEPMVSDSDSEDEVMRTDQDPTPLAPAQMSGNQAPPAFANLSQNPKDLIEAMRQEIAQLKKKSAEAIATSEKLAEQLANANLEVSRSRGAVRDLEDMLQDEVSKRKEVERQRDQEASRARALEMSTGRPHSHSAPPVPSSSTSGGSSSSQQYGHHPTHHSPHTLHHSPRSHHAHHPSSHGPSVVLGHPSSRTRQP